jgi:hypothetical protein
MKNLFTYLVAILVLASCSSRKNIQLSDGSYVTQKQYERRINKAFEESFSEVTEEDMEILDNTSVTVEFIVLDSIPVDTIPKNRFLVLDLRINMSYEQTLPVGSDFWEYNKIGVVQILDTLEFHPVK